MSSIVLNSDFSKGTPGFSEDLSGFSQALVTDAVCNVCHSWRCKALVAARRFKAVCCSGFGTVHTRSPVQTGLVRQLEACSLWNVKTCANPAICRHTSPTALTAAFSRVSGRLWPVCYLCKDLCDTDTDGDHLRHSHSRAQR